ncbi:MAG: hypothetical protein EBY22_08725 [Gammaproteobacteria bacterium]|nr:hypothetical protein [Gammaproteobacteria bacterium]
MTIFIIEEDGIEIKGRVIKVGANLLKISTVNNYLNHYLISPNDIFTEPTVNHFEVHAIILLKERIRSQRLIFYIMPF